MIVEGEILWKATIDGKDYGVTVKVRYDTDNPPILPKWGSKGPGRVIPPTEYFRDQAKLVGQHFGDTVESLKK